MSAAAANCCACWSAMATDTASSSVSARSLLAGCSIHKEAAPNAVLHLVGLEVELEVNSGIERAVGLLRLVFDVDLRKHQADRLRTPAVAAVRVCQSGDDHIVHLDDEELLLPLTCLAVCDRRFLQVHACSARLHQHRRSFVDLVGKGEVLELWLAGPRPSTSTCRRDRVCHTPGPAQDFDLVLVLVVQGLTLDVTELREDVCCHDGTSCRSDSRLGARPASRRRHSYTRLAYRLVRGLADCGMW